MVSSVNIQFVASAIQLLHVQIIFGHLERILSNVKTISGVGTAWVMGIYKNVRFDGQHILSNYCPEYLYQFSFSMVIISWIFVVVAGTFGVAAKLCQCFWTLLCCKPCKDAEANRA